MEPKNPGIPHQHPSIHIPPSSHHSLFPEQAPQPGFVVPEIGRIHPEVYPQQPHPHPHPHHHPCSFASSQSYEIQESIQREIEKSRIREEIIMAEVMRRRMLESEVRREMMMEREFGFRRGTNGFQYGLPSVMGLESPVTLPVTASMAEDERNLLLQAERERLKGRFEGGLFDDHPFQRGTANVRVSEVKSVSEGGKEKERIILLAKPGEISGSKRKAITAPSAGSSAGENPSDGILKKRAKEEWSCALCQVRATSEFALKEHLDGKRHKAKEAKLKGKGAGKSHSKGTISKKTVKIEGPVNPAAEDEPKLTTESLPPPAVLQDKNHPTALKTTQRSDNPKPKKKMKFWCEMCQVGANAEKVMEGHKNGKKHLSRLQKLNQNVGTNQSDQPGEDEKVLVSDKVADTLNESKPLDSDHVPTDAVKTGV